jgi:hypothetical protein
MPRAYGTLLFLQDGNSEGFFTASFQMYGPEYAAEQATVAQANEQPIIEVNGKLQFSLPGQPVFPVLADDIVLKPTLSWER